MQLIPPSACLLISHGSRDPRPQAEAMRLAEYVSMRLREVHQTALELASKRRLTSAYPEACPETINRQPKPFARVTTAAPPEPLVETAVLELAPIPLHQQIQQFGDRVLQFGYRELYLMPLFLLPGVHVMDDIPAEVAIAQQHFGSRLKLHLCAHLGSHPRLPQLLKVTQEQVSPIPTILVSHGSRRPGGNQPVEAIAAELGAVPAYWSVEPGLDSQVENQVQHGKHCLLILPYFLFAGGITDAIAQLVEQISQHYTNVQLQLGEPLGASPELANLVVDLLSHTKTPEQVQ